MAGATWKVGKRERSPYNDWDDVEGRQAGALALQ